MNFHGYWMSLCHTVHIDDIKSWLPYKLFPSDNWCESPPDGAASASACLQLAVVLCKQAFVGGRRRRVSRMRGEETTGWGRRGKNGCSSAWVLTDAMLKNFNCIDVNNNIRHTNALWEKREASWQSRARSRTHGAVLHAAQRAHGKLQIGNLV